MVETTCNIESREVETPPKILWGAPCGRVELQKDEIHVWAVPLDVQEPFTHLFESSLSAEERDRAARYHFDLHRRRFICGRGVLRLLLSEYLNCRPDKVQFGYGSNGKPFLAAPAAATLQFNMAHSDHLALIAVARSEELGVDVETVRWLPDFDELVNRFFSSRESACFQALLGESKPAAFFNLWTRKEALLKATGDGICNSLDRVEVTFLPQEPARLLALPDNDEVSGWILRELEPAQGYAAALAVKTRNVHLSCWEFVLEEHI